jgi:hypothetical protein
VNVQNPARRNIDHRLGQDLPIANDNHDLRRQRTQMLDGLRPPDPLRLKHGNPMRQGTLFYGRHYHRMRAPLRPVRLRNYLDHVVSVAQNRF